MRKPRIFLIFALGIGLLGVNSAIAEEYRGTMEQQMACTPDVFRLCGAEIPDANRIVACLRSNTPQLSASCRAVFESSDSTVKPPPPNSPQPTPRPTPRSYQYQ